MKINVLSIVVLMFFSLSVSAQDKKEFKTELDLIFKAFQEKKYEHIKELLDPNTKIGDLPVGMNDVIVPQIIDQMPEAFSYIVTGTIADGDNVRIETIYSTEIMPEINKRFTFNKEGKIVDFDVLSDVLTETRSPSN